MPDNTRPRRDSGVLPNLLFIYTDEQRFDTLATYGNTRIDMPHLNRLARQSVVFDRTYVTQPLCTASRSTLLTGLYPHSTGCTHNNVSLRDDTQSLPEMVTRGRYVTAHMGKWHLGDEIFPQHGFDEWRGIEDLYREFYSPKRNRDTLSAYHHFLIDNGFKPANGDVFSRAETARMPEAFGKPAFLAGEANRFIRQHRDEPFILYVNMLEPHMPFFGPRDDQYDPATIPLPANFDAVPGEDQPLKCRLFHKAYEQGGYDGQRLQTPDDWRQLIARYWGLCSLVDTHVGSILQTLSDCGLDENTIVVFTSDHGDMMGSHRLLAKCVMYEEAVRVPMMIRLPGQRSERRINGPVSQIDLVPTLLDLMGQPVPGHLQGKSLRAAMEQPGGAEVRGDVVVEWNGPNTGIIGESPTSKRVPKSLADRVTPEQAIAATADPVRTLITPDGWKFNHSTLGEHELYHLHDDPLETHNLASDPKHTPRVEDLTRRLRDWQCRTGDTVAI